MQQDLDIPKDNTECVKRYPHLQRLYISTNLLTWSNVEWSFMPGGASVPVNTLSVDASDSIANHVHSCDNSVYVHDLDYSKEVLSDVVINRGECRSFLHYDTELNVLDNVPADLELITRAFCIENLRKFSGIISIRTIHKALYSISLKPNSDIMHCYDSDMIKSLRKYYKVSLKK